MSNPQQAFLSEDEVYYMASLPVWIFYDISLLTEQPHPRLKMESIQVLESLTDTEDPLSIFFLELTKTQLPGLFQQAFKDISKPDFSHLEEDLQHATDLLSLKGVEQESFAGYQTFLRVFVRRLLRHLQQKEVWMTPEIEESILTKGQSILALLR